MGQEMTDDPVGMTVLSLIEEQGYVVTIQDNEATLRVKQPLAFVKGIIKRFTLLIILGL